MTNKQMQTIMTICVIFTVVFGVIALMTMDLLFKRCDSLERVLYNTKAMLNETTEVAENALKEVNLINQSYTEYVKISKEEHDELLAMIEAMQVAPVMEIEVESADVSELNYDYDYVLRVVAAECRGEPLNGQMAVAQCIRETSIATGMTPEEVVKQVNSNGTRQYTTPVSMDLVNDSVREACERVFINCESAVDESIRYFYSIRNGGYSSWHENSLEYVITIGNHKFFKAK